MPWFDPGNACPQRFLQQRDKLVPIKLAVTENAREQARTNGFTRVDGNDRSSAIGVAKEVVAALDPRNLEPRLPQGRDDF